VSLGHLTGTPRELSPLLCIAQAPRVLALHEVPLYLGGKPKQDRAIKISKLSYRTTWGQRTMTSGATTQFTTTLNKICTQISLFPSTLCKLSYFTLQRIGYIITSNPTAIRSQHQLPSKSRNILSSQTFRKGGTYQSAH